MTLAPVSRWGQGLLWRIEREGRPASHLYGTMHVDFPEVTRLPPPAALAFANARLLAVEVVMDAAAQQSYQEAVMRPPGAPPVTEELGATLATQYLDMARGLGLPVAVAERLTVWGAVNVIARPKPRNNGVVLDELLQQQASAVGKTVIGLETMPELVAKLDSISHADHLAVLVDSLCQAENLKSEIRASVELYLAGDLDSLHARATAEPGPDGAFRRHWAQLVDARNAAFHRALAPLLEAGGAFIAVGALHLPGAGGLLERIADAGYSVTSVFGGRGDSPATAASLP